MNMIDAVLSPEVAYLSMAVFGAWFIMNKVL